MLLPMNFKAVQFQFTPDPAHGGVSVATDRLLANLKIDNNLALVDRACRGYQAGISFNHADPATPSSASFSMASSRGAATFMARPARCCSTTRSRSDCSRPCGRKSAAILPRQAAQGADPSPGHAGAVWQSRPLGEVVRSINKPNNNVRPGSYVYTLGAESAGAPGTRVEWLSRPCASWLAARGLNIDSLMLQNGAGLSRDERASMQLFVESAARSLSQPLCAGIHRVAVAQRVSTGRRAAASMTRCRRPASCT